MGKNIRWSKMRIYCSCDLNEGQIHSGNMQRDWHQWQEEDICHFMGMELVFKRLYFRNTRPWMINHECWEYTVFPWPLLLCKTGTYYIGTLSGNFEILDCAMTALNFIRYRYRQIPYRFSDINSHAIYLYLNSTVSIPNEGVWQMRQQ